MSGARLNFIEYVCYQEHGSSPDSRASPPAHRFSRMLEAKDAPWLRPRMVVGEAWTPLDLGWLTEVSCLILETDEPRFEVIPTQQERSEAAARIIEVGVAVICEGTNGEYGGCDVVPFAELQPGDSQRLMPIDPSLLRVRCRKGSTHLTVRAFPK